MKVSIKSMLDYSVYFWISLAMIFVLSGTMLYLNNSQIQYKHQLQDEVQEKSEILKEYLENISNAMDAQLHIVDYAVKNDDEASYQEFGALIVQAMNSQFKTSQPLITGFNFNYEAGFIQKWSSFQDTQSIMLTKIITLKGETFWFSVYISPHVVFESIFDKDTETNKYVLVRDLLENSQKIYGNMPDENGWTREKTTVLKAYTFFICRSNFEAQKNANTIILILAFSAVFFLTSIYPNKSGVSPLIRIREVFDANSKASNSDRNYSQSFTLMHMTLVIEFFMMLIIQVLLGDNPILIVTDLITFVALLITLIISIRNGIGVRTSYIIAAAFLFLPLIFHAIFGSGIRDGIMAWCFVGLAATLFLINRNVSKTLFMIFCGLIFVSIIIEILLRSDADLNVLIQYIVSIFFIAFAIYSSLETYITRSIDNYSQLENIHEELISAQTQFIQNEKMATLGQLIAGVAHEINTPIGASKASAETLESTLNAIVNKLMVQAKNLEPDDINAVDEILRISSQCIKNMRSTMELRRAKTQVKKYLESIDVPESAVTADLLLRLDISDIEKLENNIDLLKRPNINTILSIATVLVPLLKSIYTIRFASEKVTKIVFALKSFSHMNPSGDSSYFDVIKSIDNVLVLYHNQVKQGIQVVKEFSQDVALVYGDSNEITQVWTNIISNAIHAMNGVGKLTVSVRNISGKKVEIAFTDTGSGITPENLKKIFAPFFTTKPLGEGSGLGLDISKKVIQKHGGDVKVASKVGVGTTFTFTLQTEAREQR